MADLFILAHADSWDRRFQVTSLAASTASVGEQVEIALFFGALDAWARDDWDRLDPAPPMTAERIELANMPPLSSMLASGRESGLIRLYACSASARLLGLDLAQVQDRVDAILGWQSFSQKIAASKKSLSF